MAKNKSEIKFTVELDENKIPEKLSWDAQEGGVTNESTKAFLISVWDSKKKETLKMDLWTKDMRIDEMDKFLVDTLGGLAQSMLTATGDSYISKSINDLCENLINHMKTKKY